MFSSSLAIRDLQIRITVRFHLAYVTMAKIKTQMTAYSGEDVEQGNTPPLLVEVQTCAAL